VAAKPEGLQKSLEDQFHPAPFWTPLLSDRFRRWHERPGGKPPFIRDLTSPTSVSSPPALIGMSIMYNSFFETTYASFVRM